MFVLWTSDGRRLHIHRNMLTKVIAVLVVFCRGMRRQRTPGSAVLASFPTHDLARAALALSTICSSTVPMNVISV